MTITVSDGTDTDTDTFTWTVDNANQDRSSPPTSATRPMPRATAVSLDADASDADSDTLTYRPPACPPAPPSMPARASSRARSRLELGHAQRDHHRPRRHRHRHRHLHLDGQQHQPGAGLQHRPARRAASEGDTLSFDADASDADLDTLTYSATGLPTDLSINASTGVISGTLGFGSAGSYAITVTVSRRHRHRYRPVHPGGSARPTKNPSFTTDITDQTDAEGDSVSLDADATDPDLDTLTYEATGLPAGVSVDAGDGCHQWHLQLQTGRAPTT